MRSKRVFFLTATAVALVLVAQTCGVHAVAPSYDDLWDLSRGTVVTSSSSVLSGSDARNIFGGNYGSLEPGQGVTLFYDNEWAGFYHFVRWRTPTDVTLGSFNLFAAHDPDWNGYGRSFNCFWLLAKPSGSSNFITIINWEIRVPYSFVDEANKLLISHVLPQPVTACEFEARFRQATNVTLMRGGRE